MMQSLLRVKDGTFMQKAAGGDNAWRSDGTFMQKAAGGYIDTKTGQYIPAN
jgi:hypothetical protein